MSFLSRNFHSSKGSTLSKRSFKKAEEVRTFEVPVPTEDVERNQKILQWMMEGEAVRNKKSPYG